MQQELFFGAYCIIIRIHPQHCNDRIAEEFGAVSTTSEQLALITADEVTLNVINFEGWNCKFDRKPAKVAIQI